MARAMGCSLAASAAMMAAQRGAPRDLAVAGVRPVRDDDHAALGERAGLVEHDRVDAPGRLEHVHALDDTPSDAPRPTPTMTAVGVASPSAHGQAMTSTATARVSGSESVAP
jgi:hypothetical protein